MALADDIAALTSSTPSRWNIEAPLGTPLVVTYSFPTTSPAYNTYSGFIAFNDIQRSHARSALSTWAATSGLSFVEVPESVGGQIRFAFLDMSEEESSAGEQTAGWAYFPTTLTSSIGPNTFVSNGSLDWGGDVYLHGPYYAGDASSTSPGQDGFSLLLHEIGHALGFKHPFEGAPIIEPAHDNGSYTVLSYNVPGSTTNIGSVDVAASQYLYGTTDAEFTFDPVSLTLSIFGTSGNDARVGTELNDRIEGREGADVLFGRDGNDTLLGGPGNDIGWGGPGSNSFDGGDDWDIASFPTVRAAVTITHNPNGTWTVNAGNETDVLSNVEAARFADGDVQLATTGSENSVYRFYDKNTGDHFYTTSFNEASVLGESRSDVYRYEGVQWTAPASGSSNNDVFRFYDTQTHNHFFTTSIFERDQIINAHNSYQYEGVAFGAYSTTGADRITLDRFYNNQTGLHHFSASSAESQWILAGNAGPGWVSEGPGFIVGAAT